MAKEAAVKMVGACVAVEAVAGDWASREVRRAVGLAVVGAAVARALAEGRTAAVQKVEIEGEEEASAGLVVQSTKWRGLIGCVWAWAGG